MQGSTYMHNDIGGNRRPNPGYGDWWSEKDFPSLSVLRLEMYQID